MGIDQLDHCFLTGQYSSSCQSPRKKGRCLSNFCTQPPPLSKYRSTLIHFDVHQQTMTDATERSGIRFLVQSDLIFTRSTDTSCGATFTFEPSCLASARLLNWRQTGGTTETTVVSLLALAALPIRNRCAGSRFDASGPHCTQHTNTQHCPPPQAPTTMSFKATRETPKAIDAAPRYEGYPVSHEQHQPRPTFHAYASAPPAYGGPCSDAMDRGGNEQRHYQYRPAAERHPANPVKHEPDHGCDFECGFGELFH